MKPYIVRSIFKSDEVFKHPYFTITFTEKCRCLLTNRKIFFANFSDFKEGWINTPTGFLKDGSPISKNTKVYVVEHPFFGAFAENGLTLYVPKQQGGSTKTVTELPLKVLFDKKGVQIPGYYKINNIIYSCKETTLTNIISSRQLSFTVDVSLTERQEYVLHDWTKHHPIQIKDRTVTITEWWLDYYRLGWLLLAFRILSGRESIESPNLYKKFCDFVEGDHDYKTFGGYTALSGSVNWVKVFV